jgi:hypothetical protein
VGVDAHTYKPVLLRTSTISFPSRKRTYYYQRVLLAKAIPYAAADFKRRGPIANRAPRPTAIEIPGFTLGHATPAGTRKPVVPAPWLTAGPRLNGLTLSAVRPFTFRKQNSGAPKATVQGLELVYLPPSLAQKTKLPNRLDVFGPRSTPRAATRSITIYEFRRVRFGPSTSWSNFPAGSIQVQTLYTTVGSRVVPTPWIAYLRKHGLYLTISTSLSQRVPLQVARSLRPGRK